MIDDVVQQADKILTSNYWSEESEDPRQLRVTGWLMKVFNVGLTLTDYREARKRSAFTLARAEYTSHLSRFEEPRDLKYL